MKYVSFDGKKDIGLLPCPFCGGEPKVRHIGNDHTRCKSVEISCTDCRVSRIDSARVHGFDWLEEITAKFWNNRSQSGLEKVLSEKSESWAYPR